MRSHALHQTLWLVWLNTIMIKFKQLHINFRGLQKSFVLCQKSAKNNITFRSSLNNINQRNNIIFQNGMGNYHNNINAYMSILILILPMKNIYITYINDYITIPQKCVDHLSFEDKKYLNFEIF